MSEARRPVIYRNAPSFGPAPSLPARHERGESRREGFVTQTASSPRPPLLVGGEGEEARIRFAQSQVLSKHSSQFESDLELTDTRLQPGAVLRGSPPPTMPRRRPPLRLGQAFAQ